MPKKPKIVWVGTRIRHGFAKSLSPDSCAEGSTEFLSNDNQRLCFETGVPSESRSGNDLECSRRSDREWNSGAGKIVDDLYAINAAKTASREAFNCGDVDGLVAIADANLVNFSDGQPSEFGESGGATAWPRCSSASRQDFQSSSSRFVFKEIVPTITAGTI